MEQNKFQNYRNKINEIIKTQKGKDDKNILEVLYGLANLEDVHSNEEKQKLNRTDFSKISDDALTKICLQVFKMTPKAIIDQFDLRRPIYFNTAAYGHFGREGFPWERTDKAAQLKKLAKI